MSSRAVNLALLALITLEFMSGLSSYLVGGPDGRWVFWMHRVGGFALVPLFGWKLSIIVRSYRKRGITSETMLSAALAVLFIFAFAWGLLWSTVGVGGSRLPVLGSLTGLGLHVTLAMAVLPLLLLHVNARWPLVRLRRPDFASRRAALRYTGLFAVGLTVSQLSEVVTRAAGWSGASRRFTGSTEIGSFSGNGFPSTNWFTDPKPAIDVTAWQLHVHGSVAAEQMIGIDELARMPSTTVQAVLDCTGGWFTVQEWSGVAVATLLSRAEIDDGARSFVFRSATGYERRYALDEIDNLLLATHVGNEALSHGHGFPMRLIAPGRRGYDWVKWVVEIEVSDLPGWLEPPLPLQ